MHISRRSKTQLEDIEYYSEKHLERSRECYVTAVSSEPRNVVIVDTMIFSINFFFIFCLFTIKGLIITPLCLIVYTVLLVFKLPI